MPMIALMGVRVGLRDGSLIRESERAVHSDVGTMAEVSTSA